MGKKSLTKSTTKKKAAAKKADESKKSAPSIPSKDVKKATPKKTAAESKTAAPKKKPTLKSLLAKDFGSWAPDKVYAAPVNENDAKNFTAPPVIETTDKASAKTLKELMGRQFDLTAFAKAPKSTKTEKPVSPPPTKKAPTPEKPAAAVPAPKKEAPAPQKPAPIEKKPVSIAELIKQSFDAWQPDHLYVVKTDENADKKFSAPPAIDTTDPAEAKRIQALLVKTFDLTVTEPAPKPATEPAPAAAKPEVKAAPTPPPAEAAPQQKAAESAEIKPEAKKEPAPVETPAVSKPPAAPETPPAPKPADEKPQARSVPEPPAQEPVSAPFKEAVSEKPAPTPAPEKKPAPADKPSKPKTDAIKEAPKPQVTPPAPPVPPISPKIAEPKEPPTSPALAILIGLVVCVFGILILASALNTRHYYLKPADKSVEIWQGKFSPTGKKLVMTVPGAVLEEPVKSDYSRSEAFVLPFNYYIQKAEALSAVKGLLDFETIKSTLYTAKEFAPTQAHRKEVDQRLNKIDFMLMIYKADVAAEKKSIEGYETALKNLAKAAALGVDTPSAKAMLEKKTAEIAEALESLKQNLWEQEAIGAAAAEEKKGTAAEKEKASKETPPETENAPSPEPEVTHH